jgi:catechol 2,3-dioxygenase-like lactoylglutathione lyase family enzyme
VKQVPRVTSSVIFVADVDRSVDFYSDVLSCETSIHDRGAALLLAPGGFQLYLIGRGARTLHPSGAIGPQYLIWAVDSAPALREIEQALGRRGGRTDTHTADGVQFVTGRDPDGIRILVAHPSPENLPRSVVDARLFA